MANSNQHDDGKSAGSIHGGAAPKKKNWVIWLLLALVAFAIVYMLRGCNRNSEVVGTTTATGTPGATSVTVPGKTAILLPTGTSGIGAFLAGTDVLPRTFVFEKLNFDTGKSDIRAADREELNLLEAALKLHPNARVRIVGYADARGAASANAALGKERAESVKAALVAGGIAADRLEAASGGETNPVDSNATSAGQAENRRTELVILQR